MPFLFPSICYVVFALFKKCNGCIEHKYNLIWHNVASNIKLVGLVTVFGTKKLCFCFLIVRKHRKKNLWELSSGSTHSGDNQQESHFYSKSHNYYPEGNLPADLSSTQQSVQSEACYSGLLLKPGTCRKLCCNALNSGIFIV